jgi:threonine dehydrogenase-like Zn-dependent dehydrogenase
MRAVQNIRSESLAQEALLSIRAGLVPVVSRPASNELLRGTHFETALRLPAIGRPGVERIKELKKGIGADSVLECMGTQESMMQAIKTTRPGGFVSYVGVPHGVGLNGEEVFFTHVHLHGGAAPVRRYLPHLIDLVCNGDIHPGRVFDVTLPLDQVAEGYRAMDERRAIKALRP